MNSAISDLALDLGQFALDNELENGWNALSNCEQRPSEVTAAWP